MRKRVFHLFITMTIIFCMATPVAFAGEATENADSRIKAEQMTDKSRL